MSDENGPLLVVVLRNVFVNVLSLFLTQVSELKNEENTDLTG